MMTAAQLTRALGGRWHQRGSNKSYGTARCVAHDDSSPSLSVVDGKDGPVATCFAGCDWRDVREELRRRGLLDDVPTRSRRPGKTILGTPAPRNPEYGRQQHEKAAWLWSRGRPIEGTPADRYLREARRYSGPIPKTLAFLPPSKPDHHPAMIAAYAIVDEPEPGLVGQPRDVEAAHLTLLRPDGSDKAEVECPKITVGSPRARPIVIAPPNDLLGLAITEGIEDALSIHHAMQLGAWAAGCASFMPALAETVPSYIEAVTIYAHDDGGKRYALQLADRLVTRDIEVRVEGIAP
jgi:Toprim domain